MTDEQRAELVEFRLSEAQSALDDARYLLAGNRSAQGIINRCYYAMFYASLALLQDIGKAPSKHAGVISLFDTEFVMKGKFSKEMSKDFHKAFELRQASDYKVNPRIPHELLVEELEKASRFVDAVRGYFGEVEEAKA